MHCHEYWVGNNLLFKELFSSKDNCHGIQIIIFCTTNGKIIDILGIFAGFSWNQEVRIINALSNKTFMQYNIFFFSFENSFN